MSFISRNYKKVAPNQVAVFYGRKYKTKDGKEIGFKVVTGGAKFLVPIVESVQMLDLSIFSIPLDVRGAPNKDGVKVSLKGIANVKILSEESALMAACERFLGKTNEEIKDIAYKNLEGHLRAIAGTMTIENLVGDRSMLNQAVLKEASADLAKMGLGIDLLTIQEVTDENGYIDQLGKKRTAEVVRDAQIGSATADKESKISTTTAQKDAAMTENTNLANIAEAEKDLKVKKANYTAEVSKQEATAEQAGPLAKAQALKGVVIAEQEMERTKVEKETEVAEARVKKTEKDLESTIVKPAEAAKEAAVIVANQNKEVKIAEAEGEKEKATKEGEGIANAIKAKLIAEAEGNKAIGLADAAVIEAKLLAEANGILKKAEAYEKLDATGRLLQVLEVVERVAPQIMKEFAGVMEAAAKPLASVDSISIVDFGSGDATSKFGGTVPGMISKFITAAAASGIDVKSLMKKFGIDAEGLLDKSNIQISPKKEIEINDKREKSSEQSS
jgi:flotillin